MEKLSEQNEQGTAPAMARMAAGMVQLLQISARPKKRDTVGGVDQTADAVLFLVEVA